MRRIASWMIAAALCFVLIPQARAQSPAEAVFAAADVAARTELLAGIETEAANDPQAAYALGALRFFLALERFGQDLHRFGFETPRSLMLPLLRMPVPANTAAEPITYERWRAVLERFVAGLERAAQTLDDVPNDAQIGLVIDLANLRLDLNADGRLDAGESLAALIQVMATPGRTPVAAEPPAMAFRFDRADGYWLQGYSHFLMANARFWLAHDFSRTFNASFQLFFPRGDFPILEAARTAGNSFRAAGFAEATVLDMVALLHTIDWLVIQPDDRRAVRTHLKQMIDLSRRNWQAIDAETDNDREWLPGPHQPGRHLLTGLEVDAGTAAGWRQALDLFEQVLDGEALIPHPRFPAAGINLKRFFDEPTRFDLVLFATGPNALPYLQGGRVLSGDDWRRVTRQFAGRNFWAFAVWFN